MSLKDYKSQVPFVKEILPSFVKTDGGQLIEFLESYYEWLELQGNVNDILYKLDEVDYNKFSKDFYENFRREILPLIPGNPDSVSAEEDTILRAASDLYSSKGTPNGIKLLFRLLFNEEVELDFPSERVLKPSFGEWSQRSFVRVVEQNISQQRISEIFSLSGKRVFVSEEAYQLDVQSNGDYRIGETVTTDSGFVGIVILWNRFDSIISFKVISGEIQPNDVLVGGSASRSVVSKLPLPITVGGSMTIESITKIGSDLGTSVFNMVVSNVTGNVSDPELAFRDPSTGVEFNASPTMSRIDIVNQGEGYVFNNTFVLKTEDIGNNNPSSTDAIVRFKDISLGRTLKLFSDSNIEGVAGQAEYIVYRSDRRDDLGFPAKLGVAPDGSVKQNAIGSIVFTRVVAGERSNVYYGELLEENFDSAVINFSNFSGGVSEGQTVTVNGKTAEILSLDFASLQMVLYKIEDGFDIGSASTPESTFDIDVLEFNSFTEANIQSAALITLGDTVFEVAKEPNGRTILSNITEVPGRVESIAIEESGSGFAIADSGSIFGVEQQPDGINTILTAAELSSKSESERSKIAQFLILVSTVFVGQGFYPNLKGQLSGDNVIRDGLRFQDYSYTVKSGIPISQWRNIVKDNAHLAGNFLAGEIQVTTIIQESGGDESLKLFSRNGISFNDPNFASSSKYQEHQLNLFHTPDELVIDDSEGRRDTKVHFCEDTFDLKEVFVYRPSLLVPIISDKFFFGNVSEYELDPHITLTGDPEQDKNLISNYGRSLDEHVVNIFKIQNLGSLDNVPTNYELKLFSDVDTGLTNFNSVKLVEFRFNSEFDIKLSDNRINIDIISLEEIHSIHRNTNLFLGIVTEDIGANNTTVSEDPFTYSTSRAIIANENENYPAVEDFYDRPIGDIQDTDGSIYNFNDLRVEYGGSDQTTVVTSTV